MACNSTLSSVASCCWHSLHHIHVLGKPLLCQLGVPCCKLAACACFCTILLCATGERAGAVGVILRSEYQKKKTDSSTSPEPQRRFVPSFRKNRSSSRGRESLFTFAFWSRCFIFDWCTWCICSIWIIMADFSTSKWFMRSLRIVACIAFLVGISLLKGRRQPRCTLWRAYIFSHELSATWKHVKLRVCTVHSHTKS